ncbi:MAG: hypothetical protein II028_06255 [Clostridia bacterium]|nr:hypothetical protein [Clostridia bacterium]
MEKPARRGSFAALFSSGKWKRSIEKSPVFKEEPIEQAGNGWEIVPIFELCIVLNLTEFIVDFHQKLNAEFSNYNRKSVFAAD